MRQGSIGAHPRPMITNPIKANNEWNGTNNSAIPAAMIPSPILIRKRSLSLSGKCEY